MARIIAGYSLLALVIALLVGASGGIAIGYGRWYRNTARPFAVRELVVTHQAAEMPKGSTVVIGDSLIERQRVDRLCGPTLNAGVGSAQASDLIPLMRHITSVVTPKLVIIEVGTNDRAAKLSDGSFLRHYRSLIDEARPARVVVVGIPGDPEWNTPLQMLAEETGSIFIPAIDPSGHTTDGVHFDAIAAALWKDSVRSACEIAGQKFGQRT